METVAPLFTALIALSMAISTLIRGARDRLHQQYAFLAGVISIVYLCLFFLLLSKDETWRYGVLSAALLVVPASLQVYGQVLHRYELRFMQFVPVLYALAFGQFIAIVLVGPDSRWVVLANATIVFGGLTVHILGLGRLIRSLSQPEERRRIGYLLWLGAVAVLAVGLEMAFLDWKLWSGPAQRSAPIEIPPIGSLATAAYIYFLGQVIVRTRLLDRHEIVARVIVFAVMSTVVGVVYGALLTLVGPEAGTGAEMVNILIASILVLILYEPVKIATEDRVFPLLARERVESMRALKSLKRRLPGMIQIDRLVEALLEGLSTGSRVDLASVYLFDETRGGFRLRRWEGDPEHELLPALPQRPFIEGFLEGRRWYLMAELQVEAARRPGAAPPPDWLEGVLATMQALQAELCVPLEIGRSVVAIWNLRTLPGSPQFSEEELELFRDVAEVAAVVIDNSRAFEETTNRDRLAALGEMSAGLAHEIRNPLGAIKGAVQVLSKRGGGRDDEWLEIIVEEVDRLNGVVSQFLDYARPMTMHVEPVDPGLLLRGVMAMVEAEGVPDDVRVLYLPGRDLPPVPMDMEKLKQVLLNIVRNGVEAMDKTGGTLTVRTRMQVLGDVGRVPSLRAIAPGRRGEVRVRRGRLNASRAIELSIEDDGIGINRDDAGKLFIPFFTTKTTGTGLGLAISERIVREHAGELLIESAPGAGTRITVRLPADPEPEPESAAAPVEPLGA